MGKNDTEKKGASMSKVCYTLPILFVWLLLCAFPSSAQSLADLPVEDFIFSGEPQKTNSAPVAALCRGSRASRLENDCVGSKDLLLNFEAGGAGAELFSEAERSFQEEEESFEGEEEIETISDPLEPLNRVFFEFNDRLYFWFLKPVARGYKAIVPQPARVGVRNFFYNLAFPVRFANCMLQGKVEGAFLEMGRFILNSIAGVGGFVDVASSSETFDKHEEDLGQTFGVYGIGPGFYINWPIFGPSSFRDTIGMVGDGFLNPVWYIDSTEYRAAVKAFEEVNTTSLSIGDYESLKKAALDPYVALRDAFYQNRRSKIKK